MAVYVALIAWGACHVFSGRAAFLITGATLATIIAANVFFVIIPNQRKITASLLKGEVPDPRLGAIAPDKGIIRRRRAIWRDPDQLAEMIAEILRLVAIAEMFAQRDEQIAVVGLHDAAAVMIA